MHNKPKVSHISRQCLIFGMRLGIAIERASARLYASHLPGAREGWDVRGVREAIKELKFGSEELGCIDRNAHDTIHSELIYALEASKQKDFLMRQDAAMRLGKLLESPEYYFLQKDWEEEKWREEATRKQ